MINNESIGALLKSRLDVFSAQRQSLEDQWLKNLRQYKGVYDPEIKSMIPTNKSKVYPKDTHTKIVGFTAKMMEMMFPASESNFAIEATEIPNMSDDLIRTILEKLYVDNQGNVTDAQATAAIKQYAADAAKRMEIEVKDQLADIGGDMIEYPQLAKKVVRSGGIYGYGVLVGPKVRTQKETSYKYTSNGVKVEVKDVPRPYLEFVKCSDTYPDLTAKTWRDQIGIYERLVMNKNQLRDLGKRDDFDSAVIRKYITEHPKGNYRVSNYDVSVNELKHTSNVDKRETDKYEVFRYLGFISGKSLKDSGYSVESEDVDFDIFCDAYIIDSTVIKLDMDPFAKNVGDEYHIFVYEEDEDSPLTGTGLPEILRDSQMKLCAVDRATMDNMAATAGPIYEVNEDLMSRGFNSTAIHAFSTIFREGRGAEAAAPAIRSIPTDSHISELLSLRDKVAEVFDIESNLPSWLMGNTQPLGEAFRTSNNMSMMQGGANMITKDIVRSFDRFTSSVIGSLVRWNMELNPKKEIKGDFQVRAKGNLSLVAKEVRGAAMEQFLAGLTDRERALFKMRNTLVERLRSRDLPEDLLEDAETCKAILESMDQAAAADKQLMDQEATARTQSLSAKASKDMATANSVASSIDAKVAEIIARVRMYMANSKGVEERGRLDHIKTMLEYLGAEEANAGIPGGSSGGKVGGTEGGLEAQV